MSKDVNKFPAPANPNIEEVLERFLEDCRRQLKSATMRKYEDIIDLFQDSMDGYAHQYETQEATEDWHYWVKRGYEF